VTHRGKKKEKKNLRKKKDKKGLKITASGSMRTEIKRGGRKKNSILKGPEPNRVERNKEVMVKKKKTQGCWEFMECSYDEKGKPNGGRAKEKKLGKRKTTTSPFRQEKFNDVKKRNKNKLSTKGKKGQGSISQKGKKDGQKGQKARRFDVKL